MEGTSVSWYISARNRAGRITVRVLALGLAGLTSLAGHEPSAPRPPGRPPSAPAGSGPPPPTGWASWNSFDATKRQTNALVSSGMATAGHPYVNHDDGRWQGDRNADGTITVDETPWPTAWRPSPTTSKHCLPAGGAAAPTTPPPSACFDVGPADTPR
ncbi:hypothetical protein [Streptomyces tailanensis]|uniref:hypothetical protein n=1 Tax=Streptomyces tailanensis TaxID=2569858 RepID=UPI00155B3304|nr:hypothetical protein [Streptomyces tailanensis]